MNVPVEVKSGLKQLKSGVEVENNTIGKSDRTSDGSGSLKSKRLIWRFVYNTCGYHHTPIPSQLSPKLEFAHPSPLSPNISTKISASTIDNLVLGFVKLTRWIKWAFTHCLIGLYSVALCLRNNLNNSQSGLTSTNGISSNSSNNLQSINIENLLYDNKLSNCTHD